MDLNHVNGKCAGRYHGHSDLPTENFPAQIQMEIDDVPVGEEMICSIDKGEVTQSATRLGQSPCHSDVIIPGQRNESSSVDVVTPKTEQSEIHPTFQDDNSSVVRKCKLDPETQSVISCPEPSSVRDDIEHPRQHPPRDIVKQEVLDTDDPKALLACCAHEQNVGNLVISCEDTKPALDSPCPATQSASLHTQCLTQNHDSSTSPGLMPVGLYYNIAHPRHSVKSGSTESQPEIEGGVEGTRNCSDNTEEMESGLTVCDRLREFLHARGKVRHRGQTNVNDTVNDLPIPKPTHNGGPPYICTFCSKTFSRPFTLKVHERVHTGENRHTCNICNKGFSNSSNLKTHQRIHTGESPYTCKICSKAFLRSSSLQTHERVHTGEKPYTCNICNKAFSHLKTVKYHQRTHTGEKPYICQFCGKSFSLSITLRKHERAHTGEKPYTCNICNKAFTQSSDLKKHERIHSSDNPYICNTCNKAFSEFSDLKKHERIHTGEKPYTCNICNKAFSQISNRKKHERKHPVEKP